jgi:diaminopimelate decarboxylase
MNDSINKNTSSESQPIWHGIKGIESINNQLYIGGYAAQEIVLAFGSPLYVYLEDRILDNALRLSNAFKRHYGNYQLLYAVKANNNLNILKLLQNAGVGADASCLNEIKLAQMANINVKNIFFSAVFPTNEALEEAQKLGVILNIENLSDIDLLRTNPPEEICFRINPNITSCGAEGLKFAGPDAKFGISAFQAMEAYSRAKAIGIKKFGAHIMTGSNILDEGYFAKTVIALFDIIGPITQSLGIEFDFINLGGSLGIPYKLEQKPLNIDKLAFSISTTIIECAQKYRMKLPKLYQEPGRYIVGDAGILLSRVNAIKKAEKEWLGIDAGMSCLIRPAMYKAYHHIISAKEIKPNIPNKYNIVGPICENTDIFATDYPHLPQMQKGEVVAILCTGAYGYGMSSQYNTQNRPAEIMISSLGIKQIRRSDTFEDLYANCILNDIYDGIEK